MVRTVAATNWAGRAGHPPAVVNRRLWGANRTPKTVPPRKPTLGSLLRTCRQQQRDALALLMGLPRDPDPGSHPNSSSRTVAEHRLRIQVTRIPDGTVVWDTPVTPTTPSSVPTTTTGSKANTQPAATRTCSNTPPTS